MAETYTVGIDNVTPVEITGGRVGNFYLSPVPGLKLGDNTITTSVGGQVMNTAVVYHFAVTSPDEAYAILAAPFSSETMTVLHCR